ncbi:MAG: class I SAM-dependent methyltransferase [Myxococcales bacterium]|nr:class I SAM-dependent methyltransferase [Myxococcales bacterium]
MDLWKYFAIGHERHEFCNPFSAEKFDELIDLYDLSADARVLDIACGKAELLMRTTRRWQCSGVGVDLSPPFVAAAREGVERAGLGARVEIVEANGSDYRAPEGSFALATCIGASWIWGGATGTLEALARFVPAGGLVALGEPFWRGEPSPEHLAAAGYTREQFGSHEENCGAGSEAGLTLLHAIVANDDDWDRYEGLQWLSAERYARAHPDDPDVPELLEQVYKARDLYLRWGRDELGWAVYLFSKS